MSTDAVSALDTTVLVETPEGVEIELRPAGLFARGMALLIDEMIRMVAIVAVSLVFGLTGLFGGAVIILVAFATYWLYGILFEVLAGGQTPGKRSQGLMVVHDDGSPVRLPASTIRNLLLAADYLPGFYSGGAIALLITGNRRIGDLVAGTLVVYVDKPVQNASKNASADRGSNQPLNQVAKPMPFPMTADEQTDFVEFLERESELSDERRQELASIVAQPLGVPVSASLDEIRAVASGLRGGAVS